MPSNNYQIGQRVTFWAEGPDYMTIELCGSGAKIAEIIYADEIPLYRLNGVNGWFNEQHLTLLS